MFENLKTVLAEYGRDYVEYLKTLMLKKNSKGYNRVASGKMLASLHTTTTEKDSVFSVILHHKPYMGCLEEGTVPHFPPRKALEKWVREKGIPTHQYRGDGLPTEEQLAYLIQQKIGREGTEGQPLMKETNEIMAKTYDQLLNEALLEDVENVIGELITDFKGKFEFK